MFDVSPFGLYRSLQIQAVRPRWHREPMRGFPPRFFCGRLTICGPGIPTSINMSVCDPGSLAPRRWAISPLRLLTVARRQTEQTYLYQLAERSISLFLLFCFSNLVQFVVFTPTTFIHLRVCLGLPFISTLAVNHCQSFI